MAAKGNEIIVSANPRGVFYEGFINTGETPKPGTIMQIDPTQTFVGGRPVFKMYNRAADGDKPLGPLFILLPDSKRGKTATDAYAAGDHCELYAPLPGEEFNLLVQDPSGTGSGTTYDAGTMMTVDDTTGELVPSVGTEDIEPFVLMEAASQLAADTLNWVMYTGY